MMESVGVADQKLYVIYKYSVSVRLRLGLGLWIQLVLALALAGGPQFYPFLMI